MNLAAAPAAVLHAIVLFLFGLGTVSFICMLKGCLALRRQGRRTPGYEGAVILKSPLVSRVSILLAVPDASSDSRERARRLVELHFGKHELVLILDGPSEADLALWTKELHLCRSARSSADDLPTAPIRGIYESSDPISLVVVDKEAGGLADALNAGLNVAASPVIGMVDPDAQFEPVILLSLIRPMLEDPDRTIAVCGVQPAPVAEGWAGRYGALDSLRMWLARCAAFSEWNLLVPVPGSTMLVLREAAVKVGGFVAGPLELFLTLHGYSRAAGKPYRVAFVPESVSYAKTPRTFEELRRWVLRDIEDISGAWHRRKSITGGAGAIKWALPGLFCMLFVRPLLETVAFILTAVGLVLGWVSLPLAGLVVLATVGVGILLSMAAVVLRELVEFRGSDPNRLAALFLATVPENLGYRQVRNVWLMKGFLQKPELEKRNRG